MNKTYLAIAISAGVIITAGIYYFTMAKYQETVALKKAENSTENLQTFKDKFK